MEPCQSVASQLVALATLASTEARCTSLGGGAATGFVRAIIAALPGVAGLVGTPRPCRHRLLGSIPLGPSRPRSRSRQVSKLNGNLRRAHRARSGRSAFTDQCLILCNSGPTYLGAALLGPPPPPTVLLSLLLMFGATVEFSEERGLADGVVRGESYSTYPPYLYLLVHPALGGSCFFRPRGTVLGRSHMMIHCHARRAEDSSSGTRPPTSLSQPVLPGSPEEKSPVLHRVRHAQIWQHRPI